MGGDAVLGNLVHQWLQLGQERQHQPRFGARGDGIRGEVRLLKGLPDGRSHRFRTGVPSGFERLQEVFHGRSTGGLGRGIGPQEGDGRSLVQFAEQVERDWIVGLETGGELVEKAGLTLNQAVLVARQGLEFLEERAIWGQAPQIGQVTR